MAEMVKTDLVTVTIDGKEFQVPKGTNLVDAAKQIGNDIPVFCYHPKMEPVGMCRMCLVELGGVMRDRATGEVMMDEETGEPKVRWFPKLQTACTQIVSDGMHVKTNTEMVDVARNDVLEFLLTSHPLDCPVCDKGGECPLQNLTMEHGPSASRMYFEDKIHMEKHYPLGDLIYLDRERCIQCARCTRFQAEIAGDDVLAFHERGRRLQIITNSDPGFDSYFSGNTTDICPVGALTTEDFRFGARPWELTSVASIAPHDPVGSNITLSTRLDRDFGGRQKIKRVMARQNEQVNEIWIDDKTRFGHHFSRDEESRLLEPMIDSDGQFTATQWDSAMRAVADALTGAEGNIGVIAGSYMSNEDLWALRKLVEGVGGSKFGAWMPQAGGDLVAQVGLPKGSNLSELGRGDAVLVIATDLEEEVPIYRLRLKQARERGANVFVANARKTRMDDFVRRAERLRYETGNAAGFMAGIAEAAPDAAKTLSEADNVVIVAGSEGLDVAGSRALMQAAANFLIETGHAGKPNNGLVGVFPGPNGMGLSDMGYTPEATQDIMANPPQVLIVAQADMLYDDPQAVNFLQRVETIIHLTLFEGEVAPNAAIALPVQSFAERDGTYTSIERRVQRFYVGQGPMGEALPAWQVASRIGALLEQGREKNSAAQVMLEITKNVPAYAGCRYKNLSKTETQYPLIGRDDVYYGGTAYDNKGGLGVSLGCEAENGDVSTGEVNLPKVASAADGELMIVPTRELYNMERVFRPSVKAMMKPRTPQPYVEINAEDGEKLGIADGDDVTVTFDGGDVTVTARVNGAAPQGTALLPRHLAEIATPMVPTVGKISK
ncbi:MAG: NADH-quinone oxidoreductase subunit NuoG [Chloroflexota bacterium]